MNKRPCKSACRYHAPAHPMIGDERVLSAPSNSKADVSGHRDLISVLVEHA